MIVRPGVDVDLTRHGIRAWILTASFLIFLLSVVWLQRDMGIAASALKFGEAEHLTTTGAFRFTRNPIYCLFLLPIAGIAGYSVPAAVLAAIAYVVAMSRLVIAPEEQALLARFGDEYRNYVATTPRWLFLARPVVQTRPTEPRGSDEIIYGGVIAMAFMVFWLVWHLGCLSHKLLFGPGL
jgi:protein-S-isoprenylcysteine O-methyltransferase Ste14